MVSPATQMRKEAAVAKIDENRHAQLLNYALGEATSAERAEVERLLKTDTAMVAELEAIRAVIDLTEEALLLEPIPKVPPQLAARLRAEMQEQPERAPGLFGLPANRYFALAAAACLMIIVGIVLKESSDVQSQFQVAREEGVVPQLESAPAGGTNPPPAVSDVAAGNAPEAKSDSIGEQIEQYIIAGSENDFRVAQGLSKGARSGIAKDAAPAPLAKKARDMPPEAPAEADEGAAAEDAFGDVEAVAQKAETRQAFDPARGRPSRIALMATSISLPSTAPLESLRNQEPTMADCLRDGFEADALLTVRVVIGVGETPSKVETIAADKMPLRDRACIVEAVENTKFTGAPEGGEFTLSIRPLNN